MMNETSDSPFPTSGTTPGSSGATSSGGTSSSVGAGAVEDGTSNRSAGMQRQGQGTSPVDPAVHRMARAAHEAVDRLEQALDTGSERVMDWQREYGEMARDQVRTNPLVAVGVAFGVGILFSKLFMR